MKQLKMIIVFIIICAFLVEFPYLASAQEKRIPKSLKATVSQTLGTDVTVTFEFCRPGVKGRKIWGELVPYGLAPGNKYSKDKPFPWRAGANKNTTIESTNDLLIEGNKLPAGKYGIHMIPSENEWIVIFSKNNSAWGSYSYNQEEDALRITVKPQEASSHQEWLIFGFEDLAGTSATAFLLWEKLKVPFKISLVN